jgi:hypothetical protein
MCSFGGKKSASAELFVIIHAKTVGPVCFSTADITPFNEKLKPHSGQGEVPM